MSTASGEPLPLPVSAIPDGCLPWSSEQARRWTQALPARWVPVRLRTSALVTVLLLAAGGAGLLAGYTALPAWVAALCALQLVWGAARPEAVRVSAPVVIALVLVYGGALPWAGALGLVLASALLWVTAELRLAARKRQREAARAATGGVTAGPPNARGPVPRGKLLGVVGCGLVVAGVVLVATAGLWDGEEGRWSAPVIGWYVVGLGVTVALSSALAHRRAAALRRAPVPVLRVLVRENSDVDAEVYAADDTAGLRPLFTVATAEVDEDSDQSDDPEADEKELAEFLDRLDDDTPGPLREAVLYGLPYDGAEVLLVGAAEEPDEPPVVERSTGPVRPLSDGFVRQWTAREKQTAVGEARQEELRLAAAAAVAAVPRDARPVPVRHWRAGWADRLFAALALLWCAVLVGGETGLWRYVPGVVGGVIAVFMLPNLLAWRVTADSTGLWISGLRRTRHVAWDHIRVVLAKGSSLKIDSHRASFDEWTVPSARWRWLERRAGLLHPHERTAAEIAAMWHEPSARPADESDERRRGRALWPLAVVVAVAWAAALVLLP
ncbi:hypothetical protein [Streptomyces griseus]|uniref:hypothetical protein n=1 Tax=Streptomyces griseus TaxID=1911 RepID=UPI00056C69AE|nr:hypothetical protein [Streptomyces griseus]